MLANFDAMGVMSSASMRDVLRRYGITARTIRHYESEGLINPDRDRSNTRRFDRLQQERLARIVQFRRAGLSIVQIRNWFVTQKHVGQEAARTYAVEGLVAQRERLLEALAANDAALAEIQNSPSD